jgi:PKD domain
MTSPRSLLLSLLAAVTVALVAPGAAGATTMCVNAPDLASCDAVHPTLAAALNAADRISGDDTILLGNVGFPEQGPFVYPNGQVDPDQVTVKGVGSTRPILTAPAGATVLNVSDFSLEGVDVRLPSAASGIGIDAALTTLRDVRVTGPGVVSGAQGIRAEGSLSLDDVEIKGTGDAGMDVFAGDVDASRLRISDVAHGVGIGDNAHLQLTRSKIAGRDIAVVARGTSAISASLLETNAPNGRGVSGGDGVVTMDHVSVVHRGPVDGTDSALDFYSAEGGGRADLRSVVLAGYTRGIRRDTNEGPPFAMTMRDSVWDPSHDVFVSPELSGPVDESGNAHVDPALVDPAHGDFRLRGSSAAVDRDTRTDLRYEDADGGGLVDGDANGDTRADAGALEYRRGAPSIESADVPGSGLTGQALSLAATGFDSDGDELHFAWDFGDGTVGAGARSTHAYAAPGLYTVALHVIDEVGLQATRTFSVAVTGAPAGTGGSSSGGALDSIAPRLSNVRLTKKRLSKSRLHAALRFTLSERATVRVTIRRLSGARQAAAKAAVVRRVLAGHRSVKLATALRRLHARPGRYAVTIRATDAAGNRSAARTVKLRVVRA